VHLAPRSLGIPAAECVQQAPMGGQAVLGQAMDVARDVAVVRIGVELAEDRAVPQQRVDEPAVEGQKRVGAGVGEDIVEIEFRQTLLELFLPRRRLLVVEMDGLLQGLLRCLIQLAG